MAYLAPPPPPAPVVVVRDIGGVVSGYRRQTELYRRQNREVRLHECRSACTMALSLPRVCVYETSVLRFHQAYDKNTRRVDFAATEEMFRSYPPAVRARLGYLTRKYKSLTGAELIGLGVRDCNAPPVRERDSMTVRRSAPEQPRYVPPGEGPVAKFLSRVAAKLFSGSLFSQRTGKNGTAGIAARRNANPGSDQLAAAGAPAELPVSADSLPAFGPMPPSRPAGLLGPPMVLVAEIQTAGASSAGPQLRTPPVLPKIITGAYPVLPPQFRAYAPMLFVK